VDAFAAVSSRRLDLQLVMAGPDKTGWTEVLKAQARARGIADRIFFTGGLFGDAKWGAIRGAEAFVLPSHQENFGIVVAEAMACGVPVLTTHKVNIWREVEASGGGFAEDDTVPGITRLLTRWLDLSAEQQAAMRTGARAGYDAHFRMEAASASLYDVFIRQGAPAHATA